MRLEIVDSSNFQCRSGDHKARNFPRYATSAKPFVLCAQRLDLGLRRGIPSIGWRSTAPPRAQPVFPVAPIDARPVGDGAEQGRPYSSQRGLPDSPLTWRRTMSSLVWKSYCLRSLVTSAPDPASCHRPYNIWTGDRARASEIATEFAVKPCSNISTADTTSEWLNVLFQYI